MENENPPKVETMAIMLSEGFIYCSSCNIFFSKQLEDAATAKRKKHQDKGFFGISLTVCGCPLCSIKALRPLHQSRCDSKNSTRVGIPLTKPFGFQRITKK